MPLDSRPSSLQATGRSTIEGRGNVSPLGLHWTTLTIASLALLATPAAGQRRSTPPVPSPAVAAPAVPASLTRLRFRDIGPASPSGRIDDFAVYEGNPAVFYIATATGGVWKSVNGGTTLEQVFTSETTSSIGDVTIAPNDPNLVWVGTGEANNRQSSSWGDGVYKSTDGGRTWTNMGLRDTKHIPRILVDPVDNDVVFVAASGNLWGSGGERGVYKSVDGGLTWARVLDGGADVGATDLVMDPQNRNVLYAAMYQRQRKAWGMNGGGPGSGIWKTTDGGRSWNRLTKGIPEGPLGRIGLDVYRKNPNVLYARIEHATETGLYRSDDGGASWAKLSTTNPRPMYFSQVRIDPNSDARIYVPGVSLPYSDDGGRTFKDDGARNIHVDFHAMWIDPANSNHIMIGGDGGVGISWDRSKTYIWLNNLPVGQFYHVAYNLETPYFVCGGLQDNNTWCGPSAVRNEWGIANDDWFIINGGDGFQAQMDPANPRILYAESQDGNMNRVDRLTNERTAIRPEAAAGEKPLRWNWDTPMKISPHDPATVYVAANRVMRSTDRGHSWTPISPDLTTQTERDSLDIMGVKGKESTIAKNDGVGNFGNLVTFAESPKVRGVLWAGSDDGLIQVSRDAGATWTNVTGKVPGLPKFTYVSKVEPSRYADGTVYATFDGHRMGDFATYIFASTDFGNSWTSIAGDLPKGEVARTITEDLKNPDVLYLGTEAGLWFSYDRGKHWVRVKESFPTVPVYEITLHERDNAMLVATHGRAIWVLDDLTPFQQYGKAMASSGLVFPAPEAAHRNASSERMRDFEGDMKFLGKNPFRGAVVSYWMPNAGKEAKLTVRDAGGATVREVSSDSTNVPAAGLNALAWDLRVQPNRPPRLGPPGQGGGGGGGGGGFGGGGLNGPLVLPGRYTASLAVDGKEVGSTTIDVRGDREIAISDADRKQHFDVLMELHRLQSTANAAAERLATAYEQLAPVRQATRDSTKVPEAVRAPWRAFSTQMDSLRRQFGLSVPGGGGGGGFAALQASPRNRVTQLKGAIMGATALPTTTQLTALDRVRGDLPKAVEALNTLLNQLPGIWKLMSDNGVYPPKAP
ncbi:MAG: hypothetical protein U0163_17560 [Gemmatimonadaceae bacterium]